MEAVLRAAVKPLLGQLNQAPVRRAMPGNGYLPRGRPGSGWRLRRLSVDSPFDVELGQGMGQRSLNHGGLFIAELFQ